MMIRQPCVAGMFYPREREDCLKQLQACLGRARQVGARGDSGTDPRRIVGGIVPHAGWICSGVVAARLFNLIADGPPPAVVILFGAVHVAHGTRASVFPSGAWETPLGLVEIEARLPERICGLTNLLEAAPHAHDGEHSIEVQLPFIQHLLPEAKIVPIMVPPTYKAVPLGAAVGRACKTYGVDAVFIGSTDLTHYGPGYGFTPQGLGVKGLSWAKDINDRRIIDVILGMREDRVIEEIDANQNACGAGAISAAIAACKACGATDATLLEHTTSYEVLREICDEPMRDAVGYAAIAFS